MSKILTVFGATGNQGGSVIASVLANDKLASEYKIRGVTRDPSKPKGQALAEKGVELVKADLSDKESVQKAIDGSHAVFAVTNCMSITQRSIRLIVILTGIVTADWEYMSKDIEVSQGKNIADACKAAGVSILIWSSIPHAGKSTWSLRRTARMI